MTFLPEWLNKIKAKIKSFVLGILSKFSSFKSLNSSLENFKTTAINIFSFLLLIIIIFWFTKEMVRQNIYIEPIGIPADLEKLGYTPHILAVRLQASIERIYMEAQTSRACLSTKEGWNQSDIEVPGTGLTARTIIDFFKDIFNINDKRISGEIIETDNKLYLHLRIRDSKKNTHSFINHREIIGNQKSRYIKTIDQLLYLASMDLLRFSDRVGYALHQYFYIRDIKNARIVINDIISNPDKKSHEKKWVEYFKATLAKDIKGDILNAAKHYKNSMEISPLADTYMDFASLYYQRNNFLKTKELLEKVDNQVPIVFQNKSDFYLRRRIYKLAKENCEEILRRRPDYYRGYTCLGDYYSSRRNKEEAENYYQIALQKNPEQSDLIFNKSGDLYLKFNNYQQAVKYYEKSLEEYNEIYKNDKNEIPGNSICNQKKAQYLWDLGVANYGTGKKLSAEKYISKAVKISCNKTEIYNLWGNYFNYEKRDFKKAIEKYKRGLEIGPDHYYLNLNLAVAYVSKGRVKKGNEIFKKLKNREEIHTCGKEEKNCDKILEYKDRGFLQSVWGAAYHNGGKFPEAIEKYQEALKHDPQNDTYYKDLGMAYYHWGDLLRKKGKYKEAKEKHKVAIDKYKTAIDKYKKSVKSDKDSFDLNPENDLYLAMTGAAYNEIGYIFTKQNQYKTGEVNFNKAIEKYSKALKINPEYENYLNNLNIAYNNRGFCLLEQKKYREAIETYGQALKLNPENENFRAKVGNTYNNWGVSLCEQKKYDEAIKVYEKAIRVNPDNDTHYLNLVTTFNNWGDLLCGQKKYKEAIEKYNEAIVKSEKYKKIRSTHSLSLVSVYTGLGVAHYYLGKIQQSVKNLELALKLDQHNTIARKWLNYINDHSGSN